MAIQIVKDNERNEYKVDGSTIYYTRISTAKRGAIIRKHTKRGKVNWVEVTNELVQTVIVGWDGVQDSGKDIAFDKDMALLLPDEILSDILELSGANIQTQEESAEKN